MRIVTSKPIAIDSPDHLIPNGTKNDNSVNPAFNQRLYEIIPATNVRLLDLGCSGGGLVRSILDDGGFAVGIEGSDYSLSSGRAEWATIPDNLFTADVTERFSLYDDSGTKMMLRDAWFNVVTAWEFFEHIPVMKIRAVCENILRHLDPDGFFIGSIATHWDGPYHVTIQQKPWWIAKFVEFGLVHAPDIEQHFGEDVVRREGFTLALRKA